MRLKAAAKGEAWEDTAISEVRFLSEAPASATLPPRVEGDPVSAYLHDCGYTFPADSTFSDDPGYEGATDECTFLPFDQICAQDTFGCFGKYEGCKSGCGAPCGGCQDTCADSCGVCKADCGADLDCLTACATSRASCRTSCLSQRESCLGDCETTLGRCVDAGSAQKEAACPGDTCSQIWQCISDNGDKAGGPFAHCQQANPGIDSRCWGWCEMW